MKKVVLTACVVALVAGCAGPNPYQVPVEERGRAVTPAEPGTPVPVESSPGVRVQPVERIPVGRMPVEPAAPVVREQRPADTAPAPFETLPANPSAAQPQSPAVVALLETARRDGSGGNLRLAQSRLERALRIAPRDPEVYVQLADVQRRQGQFLQAEQVALKGISVASGQPITLKRLWQLVADIRQEGGNAQGAQDARRRAAAY